MTILLSCQCKKCDILLMLQEKRIPISVKMSQQYELRPTFRLDVMSLLLDFVLHLSNHKMCDVHAVMKLRQNLHAFYGYSPEVCSLLEVTSHLISKLDRVNKVSCMKISSSNHPPDLPQRIWKFMECKCWSPALLLLIKSIALWTYLHKSLE